MSGHTMEERNGVRLSVAAHTRGTAWWQVVVLPSGDTAADMLYEGSDESRARKVFRSRVERHEYTMCLECGRVFPTELEKPWKSDRMACPVCGGEGISSMEGENPEAIADLLAACKDALTAHEDSTAYRRGEQWAVDLATQLRAAIARAEGRE